MASKNKGRPNIIYDESFHPDDFIKLSKKGYTITEICSEWDISKEQIYVWRKDLRKPEFIEAFKEGKMHKKAWYTKFGKALMAGKTKGSATMFIWMSKNCAGFSDEPDQEDNDDIDDVEF